MQEATTPTKVPGSWPRSAPATPARQLPASSTGFLDLTVLNASTIPTSSTPAHAMGELHTSIRSDTSDNHWFIHPSDRDTRPASANSEALSAPFISQQKTDCQTGQAIERDIASPLRQSFLCRHAVPGVSSHRISVSTSGVYNGDQPGRKGSATATTVDESWSRLEASVKSDVHECERFDEIFLSARTMEYLSSIIAEKTIFQDLSSLASVLWHRRVEGLSQTIASHPLPLPPSSDDEDDTKRIMSEFHNNMPANVAELNRLLANAFLKTELIAEGSLLAFTRLPPELVEHIVQFWVHYNLIAHASATSSQHSSLSSEYQAARICVLHAVRSHEDAKEGFSRMQMCLDRLIANEMKDLDGSTPLNKEVMQVASDILKDEWSPYGLYLRQVALQELKRCPPSAANSLTKENKGYLRSTEASRGKRASVQTVSRNPALIVSSKPRPHSWQPGAVTTERPISDTSHGRFPSPTRLSTPPKQKRISSLTDAFKQGVSTVKKKVRFDFSNLEGIGAKFGGRT